MSINEHPTEHVRKSVALLEAVKSAVRKFNAATRRWYVHYSAITFNLSSTAAGTALFVWGIPQAAKSGQYRSLVTGLILTIATVIGVWVEGRQAYVGALRGLAAFCREGLPGLIARAADLLSEAAERADRTDDK
jgi:hypothetical protein